MSFFCTPQPSRRDAVITPPVIYLRGVIGNIVTYAGRRDTSAARTKFCSKRSGAKTEGESNTVQWRVIQEKVMIRLYGRNVLWTKTSTFSTLPIMILSGRYVRLYHTGNRLSNRPSCVKKFANRCHYAVYWYQVTVSRILSAGYCQQFTVISLFSTGYCHYVTVNRLLSLRYCQQVTAIRLLSAGYCH
jgi:hypothetical protein